MQTHTRFEADADGRPGPVADIAGIASALLGRDEAAAPEPPTDPADDSLPIRIDPDGVGEAEALERLRRVALATPSTAGPRFVNQLFAGRERVACAAEMVTAILNNSMYTYKAAGPMVLVEREVIGRMLDKAGFDGGDGMFTPGGSMSNLAAMIVARNEKIENTREGGFDGRVCTLYVSAEGHYSIRKNANMVGVGRANVRMIETDEHGRMRPGALEAAIEFDRRSGKTPFMIVATAGTTVIGAFDPIGPIADIARRHDLWLHVDGAFGGSALMHPEHRRLLGGLERAGSLTWDAHKAMGVPLTCSVVLTREPGLMRKHFDESADYLFQQDAEDGWLNPGTRSLQCGRRNDALKLWAQWQALGDRGYADRVGKQAALARHAAESIRRDQRLELSLEPAWLNVCFEVVGKPSDAICRRLDETGRLKIGFGVVRGRRVIRLVTVNPAHEFADIERMLGEIVEVGEGLANGENAVV